MPEEAPDLLPAHMLRKCQVLPLELQGEVLRVAMVVPADVKALEELELVSGYKVEPVPWSQKEILEQLERLYGLEPEEDNPGIALSSIAGAMQKILLEAISLDASHIFIEPQAKWIRIRFRVQDEFCETQSLTKFAQNQVLEYLKGLTGIRSGGGKFSQVIKGTEFQFLLSYAPSNHGDVTTITVLPQQGEV